MADHAGPAPPLWRVVLEALENERCLDLHFRKEVRDPRCDESVPNYKVMKQLALKSQLGPLYRPFVKVAPLAIAPLAVLQWGAALALAALPARRRTATVHLAPTVETNTELIEAAVAADEELRDRPRDQDLNSLGALCATLPLVDVVACVGAHGRLLLELIRLDDGRRADLLLHARDALTLLMLGQHARRHPADVFVTDDHHQRWAFVLSRAAVDFRMVQHGILDAAVVFTHPFGPVRRLYVRDRAGAEPFHRYFSLGDVRVFTFLKPLKPSAIAARAVFLASSFPSIDDELVLLRRLRDQQVPIIVKLHPVHRYDRRGRELEDLADLVAARGDSPACRLFVSHSSSMEDEYRARGIPTFSMARAGGPERVAEQILAALAHPDSAG